MSRQFGGRRSSDCTMGLFSFIGRMWANYPEHVIGTAVVLAMTPFGLRAAYKTHHRPWYYRTEYTVIRDDDPYAKVLEEAYKDFVPHKLPKA
ncbi:uncharacterized protein LOC119453114 [Dermacentor silvarum]|uniref:uncharacterized protein LOC119453114 n=1 Tax=Dermacentor silvarum TaxID=543639 RepID=UPI00189ADCFC|nr:uncharacterized protein LOC119453114 [Dermacentor silvarum]